MVRDMLDHRPDELIGLGMDDDEKRRMRAAFERELDELDAQLT